MVYLYRKYVNVKYWIPLKNALIALDKFSVPEEEGVGLDGGGDVELKERDHDEGNSDANNNVEMIENQVEELVIGKGRILGGIITIGASVTTVLMIIILIYNYVNYNTLIKQSLAPLDDEIIASISTNLAAGFILRGFTGCGQV